MGVTKFIRYAPAFIKVWRKGEFIGDAVIIKSMLGKFEPSPGIASFIAAHRHETPDFSNIDFPQMPEGSFGAAYSLFMERERLKPFRFSGHYRDLMSECYLPVFYACVHDFVHVLTGYDTSPAGETGVWAFVAGQDISPQAKLAIKRAKMFFPLLNLRQTRLVQNAAREGFINGRSARQVLTMDFRAELSRPLVEVRERYHVKSTGILEVAFNP